MNNWIRADKRLPANSGKYLTLRKKSTSATIYSYYYGILNFAFNLEEIDFGDTHHSGWYYYDDNDDLVEVENVIFWMPIPKIPEGEEE